MKKLWIVIFFSLFVNTAYSQPNFGIPMPFSPDSNLIFIYGKLVIFPPDSIERMKHISACIWITPSRIKAVSVQENGDFWVQINKNNKDTLIMEFKGKPFSQEEAYYPLEITDINLNSDSLYLGVVPAVPDPFGYFEEWGTIKKNKFGGKVHYWSNTVLHMDKRLMHEDKLNRIYNSYCHKCNPIFRTDTISWQQRRYISTNLTRKMSIDYHELLSMSDYFEFNSSHLDTFALSFVHYMKGLSDSSYSDRFNKTVNAFYSPIGYKHSFEFNPETNHLTENTNDSVPIYRCFPELSEHLYIKFKTSILEVINLSREESIFK